MTKTVLVEYDGRTYEFWVDNAGLDMQVADGGSNADMILGTGHDLFGYVADLYLRTGLEQALIYAGCEIVGNGVIR